MYTYVLNILWKNLGTGMRAIHLQDFSNFHGAPYLSLLEHMMQWPQWPRWLASSRRETSEFLLLDLVECRGIQRCRGLVRNRVELVICEVPLQPTQPTERTLTLRWFFVLIAYALGTHIDWQHSASYCLQSLQRSLLYFGGFLFAHENLFKTCPALLSHCAIVLYEISINSIYIYVYIYLYLYIILIYPSRPSVLVLHAAHLHGENFFVGGHAAMLDNAPKHLLA